MTKCLVLVCLLLGTAGASSAQQGGRADCSSVTQDGNLPPATQLTDTNAAAPENAKLTAGSFSRPSPGTTSSAPSAPVPEPDPRPKFVYGSRDDYRWQLGFGVAVMRFRSAQFYATGVGTNTSLVYFTNEWLGIEGDATATFGPTVFANESVRFVSYGAGPKIAWRQRQWEPWMHAIIGGAHLRPQTAGSSNALAIQLGGGADYRLNPRLSLRLDADWVFTRFFGQSQNSAQAAVSAIFHF